MSTPTFQNIGTVAEPYWQRASMHCKVCGGHSSAQTCWRCVVTLSEQLSALQQPVELEPEDAAILYSNLWNLYG